MSALTSSASPAASPRPAYTPFKPPPTRQSRSPADHRRTASPTITNPGTSNARVPQPVPPSFTTASPPQKPQYADAGTQYSPEGYPPTAPDNKSAATGTATNKRKQTSPSPPMGGSSIIADVPSDPARQVPSNANASDQTNHHNNGARVGSVESLVSQSATSAVGEISKRARKSAASVKVMPREYETCDPKDLGVLIADMLLELIRLNDKIPLKDGKLTRFHSRAPPGISVHDYLNRLIQHATLSPPILLSMVYYIDRLCTLYPAFTIGSLTVHRFLITAATVASKGLSDSFWTNPTYARIGGISTGELATLELDFLQRVQWRIVPKAETLAEYYLSLVQRSQDYSLEEDESHGAGTDPDAMDEGPS